MTAPTLPTPNGSSIETLVKRNIELAKQIAFQARTIRNLTTSLENQRDRAERATMRAAEVEQSDLAADLRVLREAADELIASMNGICDVMVARDALIAACQRAGGWR